MRWNVRYATREIPGIAQWQHVLRPAVLMLSRWRTVARAVVRRHVVSVVIGVVMARRRVETVRRRRRVRVGVPPVPVTRVAIPRWRVVVVGMPAIMRRHAHGRPVVVTAPGAMPWARGQRGQAAEPRRAGGVAVGKRRAAGAAVAAGAAGRRRPYRVGPGGTPQRPDRLQRGKDARTPLQLPCMLRRLSPPVPVTIAVSIPSDTWPVQVTLSVPRVVSVPVTLSGSHWLPATARQTAGTRPAAGLLPLPLPIRPPVPLPLPLPLAFPFSVPVSVQAASSSVRLTLPVPVPVPIPLPISSPVPIAIPVPQAVPISLPVPITVSIPVPLIWTPPLGAVGPSAAIGAAPPLWPVQREATQTAHTSACMHSKRPTTTTVQLPEHIMRASRAE